MPGLYKGRGSGTSVPNLGATSIGVGDPGVLNIDGGQISIDPSKVITLHDPLRQYVTDDLVFTLPDESRGLTIWRATEAVQFIEPDGPGNLGQWAIIDLEGLAGGGGLTPLIPNPAGEFLSPRISVDRFGRVTGAVSDDRLANLPTVPNVQGTYELRVTSATVLNAYWDYRGIFMGQDNVPNGGLYYFTFDGQDLNAPIVTTLFMDVDGFASQVSSVTTFYGAQFGLLNIGTPVAVFNPQNELIVEGNIDFISDEGNTTNIDRRVVFGSRERADPSYFPTEGDRLRVQFGDATGGTSYEWVLATGGGAGGSVSPIDTASTGIATNQLYGVTIDNTAYVIPIPEVPANAGDYVLRRTSETTETTQSRITREFVAGSDTTTGDFVRYPSTSHPGRQVFEFSQNDAFGEHDDVTGLNINQPISIIDPITNVTLFTGTTEVVGLDPSAETRLVIFDSESDTRFAALQLFASDAYIIVAGASSVIVPAGLEWTTASTGGGPGTDNRPNLEIIRAAIEEGYSRRNLVTDPNTGEVTGFDFTVRGTTVTARITEVGLNTRITYAGGFVEQIEPRSELVNEFFFADADTFTHDTWVINSLISLLLTVTQNGVLDRTAGTDAEASVTQNGTLNVTTGTYTVTENGTLEEV